MAITSTKQTEILKIVAGLFNAAPGGTYLTEFANAVGGGMSIAQLADALAGSPVFTNGIMGGKVTTAAQVAVLMNNFGLTPGNTNATSADAQAEDYFTSQITAGVGFGKIVYDAVTYLSGSPAAEFAATAALLNNKALVAEVYSETKSSNDLATLQSVLVGVTATGPVTRAEAVAFLDGIVNAGQTYTLNEGVDNIPGTAGNDLIIAGEGSSGGVHTLGASDVINGAAGVDTIDIKMIDHQLIPRITSVEKVFAQALGPLDADAINMINATGVEELWSKNSTADLAITNLQEKAMIGVKEGTGAEYTVQAAAAAITGDLAISLDKAVVGDLFVNSTGVAGGAGYASTTINAIAGTGTGTNVINKLDTGSMATLKVVGDGAVRVTTNLVATVRTIDAFDNKGGVNLNIANNTGNVTFTGGDGADRVDFGGTLNLNDEVDGGAGRDILGVTNQASVITGLQVSNTEILELGTLNGTLNVAHIAGVDEVRVTNILSGAPDTAIVNGLTSSATFVTDSDGEATLNITNAQVAGTNDTLNLKTEIGGVGAVTIKAPGVETVAYTQNNAANNGDDTTVTFADNDFVIDMAKLTIASNAGNTINFDGLVNTIKTVDAGAAAGNVNVSIAGGNPTNGVEITGGSGDDTLTGGDGKDIIKGGAGNDIISGDAYLLIPGTGGAPIAQVSALTIANEEAGDAFSIDVNGNTYNAVSTGAGTAAGLLATAIGTAGGAIASASAVGNVVTLAGLANGTAFTLSNEATTNVAAVAATPEVSTVTIDDSITYDADDILNVTINGVTFSGIAGQSGTQQATTIAAAINAAGQMTAVLSGTLGTNAVITLTGISAVINYTVASSITGNAAFAGTPQVNTISLDDGVAASGNPDLDAGDIIQVTINGTTVNYTITGTAATDSNGLVNAINAAGLGVTAAFVDVGAAGLAADDGDSLTLTANVAGTPFTATLAVNGVVPAEMTIINTTPNALVTVANGAGVIVAVDNAPGAAVAAGVNNQTITSVTTTTGQATNDQYIGFAANIDTLTGGDGKDDFLLLSGSNGWDGTTFTTMDTIIDLKLGGATGVLGVDTIQLSSSTFSPFTNIDLINAGTPLAMTGPNLGAGVQALFNAGGALNGSVNDVGLFTFGSDTYLIVTDTAAGFTPDDMLIKVTGVTGTLDLSDVVLL